MYLYLQILKQNIYISDLLFPACLHLVLSEKARCVKNIESNTWQNKTSNSLYKDSYMESIVTSLLNSYGFQKINVWYICLHFP